MNQKDTSWYPKTAAEVMALPVGHFLDYQQINCPHCHFTVNVPRPRKVSITPYAPDMVAMVRDGAGTDWMPRYDETSGWYRQRAY